MVAFLTTGFHLRSQVGQCNGTTIIGTGPIIKFLKKSITAICANHKMKLRVFITTNLLAYLLLSTSASADIADPNNLHGAFGAVVDTTIIAGVFIGDNEVTGDSNNCEWTPSLPRDSGRDQTFGDEVEKTIDSISFRLYDRNCPSENTKYFWVAEVSTERIARNAASVAYDMIPAPFGEFAPPARQGLINVSTWFWVRSAIWQPKVVTAWVPSPTGPVTATITATPYKLVFDPGDESFGFGKKTCFGPGLVWSQQLGDDLPSPCMYRYRHSSAIRSNGLFSSTLSIIWRVSWRSNTGASGAFPDVITSSSHQMRIREFQALITS